MHSRRRLPEMHPPFAAAAIAIRHPHIRVSPHFFEMAVGVVSPAKMASRSAGKEEPVSQASFFEQLARLKR